MFYLNKLINCLLLIYVLNVSETIELTGQTTLTVADKN